MKSARTFLAALALWGCAQPEPTAPSPPENPPTGGSDVWIWLMVVDQTGVCIPGATIQVVGGPQCGPPLTQETPCNAWGYSGGVEYDNLTAGVPMTLRATAPGYAADDTTVTPASNPVSAIIFAPLPLHSAPEASVIVTTR
jgi:hypothetical protein